MNLAFDHLGALDAVLRSSLKPMPSSPVKRQDFSDSVPPVGQCWQMSGDGSSPVKPIIEQTTSGQDDLARFDSKASKNMTYLEKINCWLQNVPWYQVEHNLWVLDCFPGVVSSSGSSSSIKSTGVLEEKVERQCQAITRLVTNLYYFDDQEVTRAQLRKDFSESGSEVNYYTDDGEARNYHSEYARLDNT